MPETSVIVPAFNASRFIADSVKSLLLSPPDSGDFEIVVVDDGSSDDTCEIVESIARKNRRVRLLRNPENLGVAASLNAAIRSTDSSYIARMDADDLNLPGRLTAQLSLMNDTRDLSIVGTGRVIMDQHGAIRKFNSVRCPSKCIRWCAMWATPFAHPTVMMRRSELASLETPYKTGTGGLEDYELWQRLLVRGVGANINMPGIMYRVHPEQVSSQKIDVRNERHADISMANFAVHGIEGVSRSTISTYRTFFSEGRYVGENDLEPIAVLLDEAENASRQMDRQSGNSRAASTGFGFDLLRLFLRNRRMDLWRLLLANGYRRSCVSRATLDFLRWYRERLAYRRLADDETYARFLSAILEYKV